MAGSKNKKSHDAGMRFARIEQEQFRNMISLKRSHGFRIPTFIAGFILTALLLAADLRAQVLITPDQALRNAFGDAKVEQRSVYLSANGKSSLEKQLGFEIKSKFFTFYRATRDGKCVGLGLFDTHVVRTKNETLFVGLTTAGKIQAIQLISFYEPPEYAPPERWLKTFGEKTISGLSNEGEIHALSGATLTMHSVIKSARTALALEQAHFPSP